MPVLEDTDMVQLNSPELYNVWKGQLYIQEQLVCDIALQSSITCSIPAQLPDKLEIKEAIRLSELRKALPEDLFQNADFTGQEVCCGSVYYTLYPVIASNVAGLELDKLLKWLKDQDLALIKVLNDQGFLILVTSSVLQSNKGLGERDSSQLNALFLLPHTKLLDKKEREEWECKLTREDISLKISHLLPGFQYAIIEARRTRKNKDVYPDALVERYFKKYAIHQRNKGSSSETKGELSDTPDLFKSHGNDTPEKCSQWTFPRLQSYFSSPVNFSVPLVKVSTLLMETSFSSSSDKSTKNVGNLGHVSLASKSKLSLAAEVKVGSDGPPGNVALHGSIAKSSKKITLKKGGKRRAKKGKRKGMHQTAVSSTGENQTSNKRRRLLSGDQTPVVSTSTTTLKLASDPFSQRRKRGAEVLTAEIVQTEKINVTEKVVPSKINKEQKSTTPQSKYKTSKPRKILAPEDHFLMPDRPPKRKASDPGNRGLSSEVKNKLESLKRPVERHRETAGRQYKKNQNVAIEQIIPFSKSNADLGLDAKKASLSTQIPEHSMIDKRISMYESHALNMLADLALNSFCSSNIPYVQSECGAPREQTVVEEKANTGDSASPLEHPQKVCRLPEQSSTASKEPDKILKSQKDPPKAGSDANQVKSTSQRRTENSEKQMPQKSYPAAAKAKARNNTTSKISLEHSYSQLPMDDIPDKTSKEANEQPVQSVPEPAAATPTTEVVFQQSSNVFFPEEIILVTSENLCPAVDKEPREVSKLHDNCLITFTWEAKYDFDLDSKFTSDPLEKTINRALHGPWNPHLKEKVEDVKIILHMWLALFYSKPNKPLTCSSRKVVEHSNPAKYVSINTVLDPFELYEIVESDAIEIHTADTVNTSVLLPMGKKSEAPCQVKLHESSLLHKLGKNLNKSHPEDLSIGYSLPTKDYNIKLASEIFQMYKTSESAFFTNSLHTAVKCKMAQTSQSAPLPTNYMKTLFGASVPTVCYIDDPKLFITELNDKSENCVDIGGSSEKVNFKGNEHEYYKSFSIVNETQQSGGSQHDGKTLNKAADENKENAKMYETAFSSESTSHTPTVSSMLHYVRMPPPAEEKHEATDKRKLEITQENSNAKSKTNLNADVPHSSALNVDTTNLDQAPMDLSTQNDGHPKHPEKADQCSYESKSSSDTRMQVIQNVHTSVDQNETTLQIAESKDLLQASVLPLQDVNENSVVDDTQVKSADHVVQKAEDKELGITDDQKMIEIHSCCDLVMTESSSHQIDMNPSFCVNSGLNMAPLVDGKALESNRDVSSIDNNDRSTIESLSTSIHSQPMQSEKSRDPDRCEQQAASNLESQSTMKKKELELSKSKDSNVAIDLGCNSNSTKAGKISSALDVYTTPEDLSEKASKISPHMLEDFTEPEEHSELDKNATHAIPAVQTFCSGYSQENEHSYVSKMTVAERMRQLELNFSSDEASDVEFTYTTDPENTDTKRELESLDEAEPPENTQAEQTHSSEEHLMISTSTDQPVPALPKDNSNIPEPSHQTCETPNDKIDVQEKDHMSEMDVTEREQQEMPLNLPRVASVDPKESEAMNSDVSDINQLHSDSPGENVSELCEGEVPFGKEKPALDFEEMPLICADKSSEDMAVCLGQESESTDTCNVADSESKSVFESLNLEGKSNAYEMDNFTLVKKHDSQLDIHREEAAERRSPPLSQSPGEKESIDKYTSSVEILNDKNDLSGSIMVKMQVDALSSNTETLNTCEMVVQSSETLETCKEVAPEKKTQTVAEKSVFNESNEVDSLLDSTVVSSDVLVSKCSERNAEQQPVQTQQSDITANAVHLSHPLKQTESKPKDMGHSSRNISNNRKEILSKLKLICLGSVTSQQARSSSEDVLFICEKGGRSGTEEQNEPLDPKNKAENVQIHDGNKSTPGNTDTTMGDTAPDKDVVVEDHLLQEISVSNATLTAAEPESSEELLQMLSQNNCISPSQDDFTDNVEHDPVQEKTDICFIVNTGSISKEQYDRWSETSDEDIEFIQAYKEPLSHQENKGVHKESQEFPSSYFEELTFCHEPTYTKKTKYFKGQSCPSTRLCETDEYLSKYHRDIDYPSIRGRGNVIATKNLKDTGRTMHKVHKESSYPGMTDLDSLFSNRRMASEDLTQNTIDMEHLRFTCKLKEVLRKSSTSIHVCEPPSQTMFESRRIPGCSSSTTKFRSPLLITVHCPHRKRDFRGHDNWYPSTYYSQPYYEEEIWDRPVYYSRTPKKVKTHRSSPYHFSRLRYENTVDKSNSDISVILKECVQSNHLKLNSVGLGKTAIDRTTASQLAEDNGRQARRTFVSSSPKSQTVKNIISDLCTSLHSRLHSVAREFVQNNVYFYISETSDDAFLSSTKSLLIKDGHTPTEPKDFCVSEHAESNKLLVIIRNEDVSSYINKIPCLLQLKLLPNVTFAGVDSPEDVTESTYQELFQAGGFVVSNKTVLENITLGKLKEVLTVMEKMNGTSAWKWLIHYSESKKLKEDKRAESVSQTKISLLKSYQQSNIIEMLPYHQCDSRNKELSHDLACLLALQSQHIHSRLAVYLTGTPSTVAEEFEQNGILVYDVDTFIRKIQKVDVQLQTSYHDASEDYQDGT